MISSSAADTVLTSCFRMPSSITTHRQAKLSRTRLTLTSLPRGAALTPLPCPLVFFNRNFLCRWPCKRITSLDRASSDTDIRDDLDVFDSALSFAQQTGPAVIILENVPNLIDVRHVLGVGIRRPTFVPARWREVRVDARGAPPPMLFCCVRFC